MTHELKTIVEAYRLATSLKMKCVLASVVALEGSSYRKPGVRMLLREDGTMVGAVSGGCVEKEVLRQAQSVFKDGISKVMTYDGRYRLGCEGILYILLEPFVPDALFLDCFDELIKKRTPFSIGSYFRKVDATHIGFGSIFNFGDQSLTARDAEVEISDFDFFEEQLPPCFRLLIIGSEHDAVQLCKAASLLGWEVSVVTHPSEEKKIKNFPGATKLLAVIPEDFSAEEIDTDTAVVLMTHSYVKDLKFLLRLKDAMPIYIGLLGPASRRERLLSEFIEYHPEVGDHFFERMHGPAGLDVGAETPQEIAISVLSEILTVVRNRKPAFLRDKRGAVHDPQHKPS